MRPISARVYRGIIASAGSVGECENNHDTKSGVHEAPPRRLHRDRPAWRLRARRHRPSRGGTTTPNLLATPPLPKRSFWRPRSLRGNLEMPRAEQAPVATNRFSPLSLPVTHGYSSRVQPQRYGCSRVTAVFAIAPAILHPHLTKDEKIICSQEPRYVGRGRSTMGDYPQSGLSGARSLRSGVESATSPTRGQCNSTLP